MQFSGIWENMNKIKEKVESCGLKVVVDVAAKAELPLCCGNLVQDYKKNRQEERFVSFENFYREYKNRR